MNPKEFFDKEVELREAQKAYFASTHDRRALDKARKIEAEIDREIKRVKEVLARQERDRLQKVAFRRLRHRTIKPTGRWK